MGGGGSQAVCTPFWKTRRVPKLRFALLKSFRVRNYSALEHRLRKSRWTNVLPRCCEARGFWEGKDDLYNFQSVSLTRAKLLTSPATNCVTGFVAGVKGSKSYYSPQPSTPTHLLLMSSKARHTRLIPALAHVPAADHAVPAATAQRGP